MNYTLIPILGGGKVSMGHAANILENYNKGLSMRHLDGGFSKEIHAKILVEQATKLVKAGRTESEMIIELSSPVWSIGNTAAWNKLINENLQWEIPDLDKDGNQKVDKDGNPLTKKIQFRARFKDTAPSGAHISMI
jgi:hypothetical protein